MHSVYSYPELRHLRQETSDTVVTPSIPDMTLAVVELNDSAKRVSFIGTTAATAVVARAHCKKPGISHDALLKINFMLLPRIFLECVNSIKIRGFHFL